MGVNSLTYEQISTVLNGLLSQMKGGALAGVNSNDFTSVATTLLQGGTDPLLSAISQMVGKTIFSVRPYNRKLGGIQVDSQRWGYITRKLALADKAFENDASFTMTDGNMYSPWYVNMPNVLQLNYYGQNVFEKSVSIFKNQLDGAFTSRESFGSFISMVMQNASDMIEQSREASARMTLGNFIGGKIEANNGVIKLVTEYNTEMGYSPVLTWADIKGDTDEYDKFIKWMYAKVATISDMMTERTNLYQIQVTNKTITRHTPQRNQKVYMIADFLNAMKARVLSGTYNDGFLKYADVEAVNFWQTPADPYDIYMKPAYLQAAGTITQPANAVHYENIVGVIFDEDALGLTVMDEWTQNTGMNAKYGYDTTYFHYIVRYWNDFTEKGVVLKLE